MVGDGYQQMRGSGLCGPASIINAVHVLYPRRLGEEDEGNLLNALLAAVPGDVRDLIADGCDRDVMARMLDAASGWVANQAWPALTWEAAHPKRGVPSGEFLDRLGFKLRLCQCAAIVGFGEDTRESTAYEPHWTCIEAIKPRTIDLRDSCSYGRVPRRDVGIRPEPGWEIQDCYLLRREE